MNDIYVHEFLAVVVAEDGERFRALVEEAEHRGYRLIGQDALQFPGGRHVAFYVAPLDPSAKPASRAPGPVAGPQFLVIEEADPVAFVRRVVEAERAGYHAADGRHLHAGDELFVAYYVAPQLEDVDAKARREARQAAVAAMKASMESSPDALRAYA